MFRVLIVFVIEPNAGQCTWTWKRYHSIGSIMQIVMFVTLRCYTITIGAVTRNFRITYYTNIDICNFVYILVSSLEMDLSNVFMSAFEPNAAKHHRTQPNIFTAFLRRSLLCSWCVIVRNVQWHQSARRVDLLHFRYSCKIQVPYTYHCTAFRNVVKIIHHVQCVQISGFNRAVCVIHCNPYKCSQMLCDISNIWRSAW